MKMALYLFWQYLFWQYLLLGRPQGGTRHHNGLSRCP